MKLLSILLLLVCVLLLSACSRTVDIAKAKAVDFPSRDKVESGRDCVSSGGRCVDFKDLSNVAVNETQEYMGRCDSGACFYPYKTPVSVMDAYNIKYISYDVTDLMHNILTVKETKDEWIFIKYYDVFSYTNSYGVNKKTGIINCFGDADKLTCNNSTYAAVIGMEVISEDNGIIKCHSNMEQTCPEKTLKEYNKRKKLL